MGQVPRSGYGDDNHKNRKVGGLILIQSFSWELHCICTPNAQLSCNCTLSIYIERQQHALIVGIMLAQSDTRLHKRGCRSSCNLLSGLFSFGIIMFPVPDHRSGMKWESLTERAPSHRSVGVGEPNLGKGEVNNGGVLDGIMSFNWFRCC